MCPDKTAFYTPADLGELDDSSGTDLLNLLENMPNDLEAQISKLLESLDISPKEIFIDEGPANGEILSVALKSYNDYCFMKD